MANITQSERDKNWEEYLKKRSSSSKKKVIKMDWGDEDKQTQKTASVSVPASAPVQERKTVGELRTAAMERQNKRAVSDKSAPERAGEVLSSMGKKTLASVGILAKGTADSIVDSAKNRNNEKYQKAKDRRAVLEGRLADSAYDFNADEGIEAPGGEAVTKQAIIRAGIEKAKEEEEKHKSKSVIPEEHWAMKLYESGEKDEEKAMEGLSENAKKLFGVGISIADTALTLPTAAISPSLPGTIMATKAAAGKTYELSKQGVSSGEALARGLVSGGIEYVTEKLPIDNIIDAVKIGGKPLVKSVLKQMGTEASEESVSYVLNHIADKAAQDPNAEFSFEELAASALGGAVSGGVFGAGANIIGNIGKSADVDVNIPKDVENKVETPANNSDIESDTVDFSAEVMSPNDNVREMYRNKKTLDAEAQEVESNIVLTDIEQGVVRSMLAGNRKVWDMPQGANVDNIMAVYRAKKAAQDNDAEIGKHNSRIAAGRRQKAVEALKNVSTWKDKKAGILYQRETMERNFRDIIPDKAEAEKIIAEYITPVHKGEANSNRLKNTMRKVIKDLNLSDKKNHYVEYMNGEDAMAGAVSESSLVQLLGEGKITDADVIKSGADLQKIKGAVDTFRSVYNGLIDQMNDVLVANGYAPVDYRKDYFPHFETEKADTLFLKVANALGFELKSDNLPTDIAGRTHERRPGRVFSRFIQRRTGVRTEYDALKGFDMYIENIADVIHHTENIRNIRALEDELRYETTDEATRKKVDEIRAKEDIDELEKRQLIEEVYEKGLDRTQMSNLAIELRAYGDMLANKKAIGDRNMEHATNRVMYDFMKKLQGRVSSNMVAVNPSSWLTNIIPITQGMSQLSHGDAVKGMAMTLKSSYNDDGFADRSTFLTNRRGSDFLVKTKVEKAGDWAASPMYYIDDFVANALVRGKYNENIRNGMDEMSAIDNADAFAASIMADRSKGAMPTIFHKKNPFAKPFTTFQVEVNNQLSYVVKDLPRMAEEEKKNLIWGLTKMFVYAFLYNQLYELATGRRPALDPIDMAFSFVEDVKDTETPLIDDMINFGKDVAEQIPFVGAIVGGGRLPISSALPDSDNLKTMLNTTVAPEKRKQAMAEEATRVAVYYLVPFGGGQLKKTIEGVSAYAQGGSYTYDNKGNRKLNFPVEQTAGNAVRGAMFGQYAYDTAQEFVDSGFKEYSETETEIIDSAEENGIDREKMITVVNDTRGLDAAKTRQYIYDLPWTRNDKQQLHRILFDGKSDIDYTDENSFKITSHFDSDNQKKYAKKAVDMGVDIEKVIKCFDEQKGEEGVKFQGKTVPNSRRKAVERVVMKYAKNEAQFIALMRLAGFTSYDSESYKMRKVPS